MRTQISRLKNRFRSYLGGIPKAKGIHTIAVCAAQVPFFRGGAEVHVKALARELQARNYEVDLINIPYKWYPHEQLLKSIEIWQILDLTESNGKKIDLVIATKFPSYFVNHPRKILWLIHQYRQIYDLYTTSLSGFNPKKKKDREFKAQLVDLDTHALRTYKKIFTNSKNTANRLKKYNNIDSTPLYHPPKLAGKYYHKEYGDYILSVGRLDLLKRVDVLIKSLQYCHPDIKCKIAGTGPDLNRLQSLAQSCGVSDRVEFVGYVSDEELLHLYANCFSVFFAPLDEDYGYVTLEAFLSKKPVVTCYDSGGPLEFVEPGKSGTVLKSFEEKEVARQIEELFNSKQKCESYGEYGYSTVKSINWTHVIEELLGAA